MELGLTQAKCAARARISRPYLSQLETGARRDMQPPTYKRLRTVLRLSATNRRLLAPEEAQQKESSNAHDRSPQ
jgi:transcriptional regulator with XRE-family HTH domain